MRDLDLNDLRVYVRVADRGGFAAAARELRVPTSTVSRAIARLERATGTRLFQRTSRSVQMTSEGRALYASVQDAVATLDRAVHALEPAARGAKGTLRVSAPLAIGGALLAEVAVAFAEKHPLVQLDFALTNRAVNLVQEGIDIALRAAAGRLPDSSLVARKLGELEHGLYASPQYLERTGMPSTPGDLAKHRCIVFRAKDLARTWRLEGGGGTVEVDVRARLGGDEFGYVHALTIAGGGIALMPRFLCRRDESAGRLVRVLPTYAAKGASLYVVHASTAHVPTRVTAFVDFLAAALRASGA